jgi:periplasmic divalent cation tolerance protein
MTDIRLIYVTTKNPAEAREIAHKLLETRLIACANIVPQIESIYKWDDRIQSEAETVLLLKTEARLVDEVLKVVEKLHSYETPCALSFAVEGGSTKYIAWLKHEVN